MLEERSYSTLSRLDQHMTWAETIWEQQQKTTERLEEVLDALLKTVITVSQKLWMILGACSFAAASTGILTWLLSKPQ